MRALRLWELPGGPCRLQADGHSDLVSDWELPAGRCHPKADGQMLWLLATWKRSVGRAKLSVALLRAHVPMIVLWGEADARHHGLHACALGTWEMRQGELIIVRRAHWASR